MRDSDDSAELALVLHAPVPPGLPAKTPAAIVACIADWMATRDVDAVVWMALPAKFAGVSERAPSPHEAVALLAGLQGGRSGPGPRNTCAGFRGISGRCIAG